MCQECGKGFCRDKNNGLSCWSHHVALGGIPKPPKYGTRKKKLNECMECNQLIGERNLDDLIKKPKLSAKQIYFLSHTKSVLFYFN